MKKQVLVAGLLAATLCMPLAGLRWLVDLVYQLVVLHDHEQHEHDLQLVEATAPASEFDANKAYAGQWRGSVEITGQTVYGTAGGSEQMLDVNLNDDGTCEVKPLEAHADLLTDTGTWEGTEDEITLHLSSKDITLKVVDKNTLEGNAADFDIADFDTIDFDFYG
jgi:hypothetical protein